jgi:hypothetical protein
VSWAITAALGALLPVVLFVVGDWVVGLVLLVPWAALVAWAVMLTIRAVREGNLF